MFLVVIFVPLVGTFMDSQRAVSTSENRQLAVLPVLSFDFRSLIDFPAEFESYFNDHFGFRDRLICLNNYILVKFFGESPSKKIIVGENGWLYVTEDGMLNDFLGIYKLTPLQLESWRDDLEKKEQWLSEQGIRYLFVIAPNKQTIYPEYMPYRFRKAKGKTQLDQLTEYLNNYPEVNLLDLRAGLLAVKKKKGVFYRTDTHWNDIGAYVSYKTIADKLSEWFSDLTPREYIDFMEYFSVNEKGKEISRMLGLEDKIREGGAFSLKLKAPCASEKKYLNIPTEASADVFFKDRSPFLRNCERSKHRALILRDSFFTDLDPLISEHFNQVVYVWTFRPLMKDEWQFSEWTTGNHSIKEFIDYYQPDIVIEEKAERLLYWGLPPESYHIERGNALLKYDQLEESFLHLQAALKLNPGNKKQIVKYLYAKAFQYTAQKDYNKSIFLFKKIVEMSSDEKWAAYNIACIYAQFHRNSLAIEWLKKSIAMGFDNYHYLRNSPELDNIKESDEFKRLVCNHS